MTAREMTMTSDDPVALPRHGTRERAVHPHHRRATFVRWVRKTHGWFGLWGALLGLIFVQPVKGFQVDSVHSMDDWAISEHPDLDIA